MDTTSLVFTIIAAPAGIAGAYFAYRALYPPKRELQLFTPGAMALIRTSLGASTSVEIRHGGRQLQNPHIMQVSVKVTGRHSIRTDDFDQGRPLVLSLSHDIVADLSPLIDVVYSIQARKITIGPDLLNTGSKYTFTVLLDDAPDNRIRFTHHLIDTQVNDFVHLRRRRRRFAIACVVADVVIGLSSFLFVSALATWIAGAAAILCGLGIAVVINLSMPTADELAMMYTQN